MTDSPKEKINETTNETKEVALSNDVRHLSSISKATTKLMSRYCVSTENDPIILLNVAGTHMSTKKSTLMLFPNTVLALICTSPWSESITHDNDGRIYFDCDPILFQYLLNQLREWSPTRKVFELPRNELDRQRFRSLCMKLNFHSDLVDGIHRQEKFNKICGHVILEDNGLIAIHANSYRYAECRGMNVYSSGINRIMLVLKNDVIDKYNTFIGIIWSGSPMQEKSFETPTAYGWGGGRQVYLKGVLTSIEGYGGYDSDLCTNDRIELTLNCQLCFISMRNHRTKKYYQIPIDIYEGCPFPWQLNVNLFAPDDRIKIINPE